MSRAGKDGQQLDKTRAGVPPRDAAAIRELGGNHGDEAGRLKGESVAIVSRKYLLLPGDTIIPNNLTIPEAAKRLMGFQEEER